MDGEKGSVAFSGVNEGSQETAYIPIRVLGRGAFGEAVLYRKYGVSCCQITISVNFFQRYFSSSSNNLF